MKALNWLKQCGARIVPLMLLCALAGEVHAQTPPADPTNAWLNYWSFYDTNTWCSDLGHVALSGTNLNVSLLGNGSAVVMDSPDAAWLRYNVQESDGTNNLSVNFGSVMFWFAPNWAGTNQDGTGPGQWGRLLEVGDYTTNASYGWWSLYVDPAGANIYFAAQTNGAEAVYLSCPIAWTTNRWHLIALTYSATNSSLYLDGELVTNGLAVTYWPGPDVLTNGFYVGSDHTGVAQARGMFDDLSTYNYPLAAATIYDTFNNSYFTYWVNPENFANTFSSAASTPRFTPTFNAVTGSGYLTALTNAVDCVTNSNVWITNSVAARAANGTMNLTFAISGGSNAVAYDVFANSLLVPVTSATAWAWMGQGYHCTTYLLTNLPSTSTFLMLAKPTDSDLDGLTDAYENLVSKTDPNNPDTDGDGVLDGWEVVFYTNPKNQDSDGDGVIDQPFQVLITRPGFGGGL